MKKKSLTIIGYIQCIVSALLTCILCVGLFLQSDSIALNELIKVALILVLFFCSGIGLITLKRYFLILTVYAYVFLLFKQFEYFYLLWVSEYTFVLTPEIKKAIALKSFVTIGFSSFVAITFYFIIRNLTKLQVIETSKPIKHVVLSLFICIVMIRF